MALIRLNKYLAQLGIASRREADRMISDGLISVNGEVIREMGVKVDPEIDKVSVSDRVMKRQEKLIYIMLHKPIGYVSSAVRTRIEKNIVLDLVNIKERI
jgi:23S rRNA pseudouridine2605 synthase